MLSAKQEARLTPTHYVLAGIGLCALSFALAFWRTKRDNADHGIALTVNFSLSASAATGFAAGLILIVAGAMGH